MECPSSQVAREQLVTASLKMYIHSVRLEQCINIQSVSTTEDDTRVFHSSNMLPVRFPLECKIF